jgi:hypothetical protein
MFGYYTSRSLAFCSDRRRRAGLLGAGRTNTLFAELSRLCEFAPQGGTARCPARVRAVLLLDAVEGLSVNHGFEMVPWLAAPGSAAAARAIRLRFNGN